MATVLRCHITFADGRGGMAAGAYAHTYGGRVIHTVSRFDGVHERAIIEVPASDEDALEDALEKDANVIEYQDYTQETP